MSTRKTMLAVGLVFADAGCRAGGDSGVLTVLRDVFLRPGHFDMPSLQGFEGEY